jgi:hypothetical protein
MLWEQQEVFRQQALEKWEPMAILALNEFTLVEAIFLDFSRIMGKIPITMI